MYRVTKEEDITQELVIALIERYKQNEVKRIQELEDYYVGKTAIHSRYMKDLDSPNNQLSAPHATYIVDTTQGYFLGNPVAYSNASNDDGITLLNPLQEIYKDNDEQAHNTKVSKEASITGVGYELVYLDDDDNKSIRFSELNPKETFIIWDKSTEAKMLSAVRFYENYDYITDSKTTSVEVYGSNSIKYFKIDGKKLDSDVEEVPHMFGEVPVVQYVNNDELTGDFEKVKDLIDGYDQAISDTANNIEYFADSYLFLSGLKVNEEDVSLMKENRVLVAEEGGNAEWVTKSSANMELEEHKNRLKEDIHMLAHVPRLDESSFGTSTSGESLKYKMLGLENLVSIKERLMRKSLQKRIKLITNMLKVKGTSYDPNSIKMSFKRNLPINQASQVDMIVKLKSTGLVSDETLVSLVPGVENPDQELLKAKSEQEQAFNNYSDIKLVSTDEASEVPDSADDYGIAL